MRIIPVKEGDGPTCHEHAFYSKQKGDFSKESNPPAIWYFEIGGRSLWLCDNCKNTLRRISGGSPTTGTPEGGYHPGSLADPRD